MPDWRVPRRALSGALMPDRVAVRAERSVPAAPAAATVPAGRASGDTGGVGARSGSGARGPRFLRKRYAGSRGR